MAITGQKHSPHLASFGKDSKGVLADKFGEALPFLKRAFPGGMSLALTSDTIQCYRKRLGEDWYQDALRDFLIDANDPRFDAQNYKFYEAIKRASQKVDKAETKAILVADFDRAIRMARTSDNGVYPSDIERLAQGISCADFTFCKRTQNAFFSHPAHQTMTEVLVNWFTSEAIREYLGNPAADDVDLMSGAYGISPGLLARLLAGDLHLPPDPEADRETPYYALFCAKAIKLCGHDSDLNWKVIHVRCLDFETPDEREQEIVESGGVGSWLANRQFARQSLSRRIEMAHRWTEVLSKALGLATE